MELIVYSMCEKKLLNLESIDMVMSSQQPFLFLHVLLHHELGAKSYTLDTMTGVNLAPCVFFGGGGGCFGEWPYSAALKSPLRSQAPSQS